MSNRTKQELAASLKKILQEKPLEKITIGEITADCGYSRMTFYYHFRDIYDLVEWMCLEDLRTTAGMRSEARTWQEWLTRIFEEMHAQRAYIGNLNRSLDRTQIENFWTEQIYTQMLEQVRSACSRCGCRDVSEEKVRFIASFYRYSFVGVLMEWFDQGMKSDYEAIVRDLSTLMEGSIERAVRSFARSDRTG